MSCLAGRRFNACHDLVFQRVWLSRLVHRAKGRKREVRALKLWAPGVREDSAIKISA